jgi:hypothetical protein
MATIAITVTDIEEPDSAKAVVYKKSIEREYEVDSIEMLFWECLDELKPKITSMAKARGGKLPKTQLLCKVTAADEDEKGDRAVLSLSRPAIRKLSELNMEFGYDPYFQS